MGITIALILYLLLQQIRIVPHDVLIIVVLQSVVLLNNWRAKRYFMDTEYEYDIYVICIFCITHYFYQTNSGSSSVKIIILSTCSNHRYLTNSCSYYIFIHLFYALIIWKKKKPYFKFSHKKAPGLRTIPYPTNPTASQPANYHQRSPRRSLQNISWTLKIQWF